VALKGHAVKKPARSAVPPLTDGMRCRVIGGSHAGKSGTVADIKTSKTGHATLTVVQANGVRFKTLAKNVAVQD
jgi:ribosomal protein S4E